MVTEKSMRVNGDITLARIKEMIGQSSNPSYIPPVNWNKVGRLAFRNSYQLEDHWPAQMKQGWWDSFGIVADAVALVDAVGA